MQVARGGTLYILYAIAGKLLENGSELLFHDVRRLWRPDHRCQVFVTGNEHGVPGIDELKPRRELGSNQARRNCQK